MASRHACTDPHHHVDSADAFVRAVERACVERGLRLTPIRANVLRLIADAGKPVKAYDLLEKVRNVRVMLLNGGSRILGANNPLLARLTAARVSFDLATLEGVGGIGALLERRPDVRLSFGSQCFRSELPSGYGSAVDRARSVLPVGPFGNPVQGHR